MDISKTKRTIYLISAVLVLAALSFLLYKYLLPVLQKPSVPGPGVSGRVPGFPGGVGPGAPSAPGVSGAPGITGAPEQKLLQLTDFSIMPPSLNKDEGKIMFYKKEGGDVFAEDFDGRSTEKISIITVVGLTDTVWSPLRDRAAVFYLDNETMKGFLRIGTSSVAVLPQDVRSFDWSPDGKNLAYLIPKGGNLNLVVADSSAKNSRNVFSTPILDSHIKWVTSDKIAFETAPSGLAGGFIFSFSRSSGSFKRVVGPLFGLMSSWSPDGSKILVSATDAAGKNPVTALFDSSGKRLSILNFSTLPSKCVWASSAEVYCAVPRLIADSPWPDTYLRGETNTQDTIIRWDIAKNNFEDILDEGNFDMANLLLTKDKSYLFFVNRTDGTLWRLKLK